MDDDATKVVTESHAATDPGAPERPPLERGEEIGRYVVLHAAGSGGMGQVYAAYDPELDRKVALKLLPARDNPDDPHADVRLLREAQALAKLSHPNVVAVYDAGTHGDRVYVAMEYVEGVTLQAWLRETTRRWPEVLAVMIAAARGLAAAHAAGIIHRDVKPANVMLHRDGSARVLDFGLARRLGGESLDEVTSGELEALVDSGRSSRRAVDESLTRTGLVTGTPAYMAPEQFTAGVLDERTDQFGFCVTTYEALYGSRPFVAKHPSLLRRVVLAGRVAPAPADSTVPLRLRRCLLRGLAVDPAARWPTMDALVEALERAARPRWRRAVVPVVTATAVAGLAIAMVREPAGLTPCSGVEDKLASAWDADRAAAIAAAFARVDKPYAADVLAQIEPRLSEYAAAWAAQRRDACEATRVRAEQSDELLDRRMACLDDRLLELGVLTEQLAIGDAQVVEKAVDAVGKLGDLARCEPTSVLREHIESPPPQLADQVGALRGELARNKVLTTAGKYADALAGMEQLAASARAIDYPPLLPEVLVHLAALKGAVGDFSGAESTAVEALLLAEATGHGRVEFESRITLASVVGLLLARPDEGRVHMRFAKAVAERLGPQTAYAGHVALTSGLIELRVGDHEAAVTWFEQALAEREAVHGVDHPDVATIHVNLGVALSKVGRFDEAFEHFERASGIYAAVYGVHHPLYASALHNLANALHEHGRDEEALATHERALAVWTASVSEQHPEVAKVHHNMGVALMGLGRIVEAKRHYELAIAAKTVALGPDHPSVAMTEQNLADLLHRSGRAREALPLLLHARTSVENALGADHVEVATVETTLGNVQLTLGHPHDAAQTLRHAARIMAANATPPAMLADLRFDLAVALAADRAQGEAITAAEAARAGYAPLGERYAPERAEIDAWLAAARRGSGR